jgi:hypothetical protein
VQGKNEAGKHEGLTDAMKVMSIKVFLRLPVFHLLKPCHLTSLLLLIADINMGGEDPAVLFAPQSSFCMVGA